MDLDQHPDDLTPSWRKPAGVLGILLLIAVWAAVVVSLSEVVGRWHWAGQLTATIQALFSPEVLHEPPG